MSEILTTDEVAELLRVPKATLYKWVSEGKAPPFYKIGRYNRWKRSEVMAWFDEHIEEISGRGRAMGHAGFYRSR